MIYYIGIAVKGLILNSKGDTGKNWSIRSDLFFYLDTGQARRK